MPAVRGLRRSVSRRGVGLLTGNTTYGRMPCSGKLPFSPFPSRGPVPIRCFRYLRFIAALAAAPLAAQEYTAGIPLDWPLLGRSRVTEAPSAMVVSGHPLASEVGRDVLKRGGNAIDAAVAVGFALAVVHPEAGNIGGGGFMVIRMADGKVQTLDYREAAPGRASRDMYLSADPEASVTGHLAAGVPGAVAGLTEAHGRYGRLPFSAVITPAIRLAYDGFVVDEYRSSSIGEDSARLVLFPASRTTFLPNDRPPAVGSTFRQPELGATLEAVRDSGAAGFYSGRVADLLVAEMVRGGGLISRDDLAAYRAIWRN